jgi:hypothetical protein
MQLFSIRLSVLVFAALSPRLAAPPRLYRRWLAWEEAQKSRSQRR